MGKFRQRNVMGKLSDGVEQDFSLCIFPTRDQGNPRLLLLKKNPDYQITANIIMRSTFHCVVHAANCIFTYFFKGGRLLNTRLIQTVSTVSLLKISSKVSYIILLLSDSTFFKLFFHIFAAITESLIVAGHKFLYTLLIERGRLRC